jgi:hypothetical protein
MMQFEEAKAFILKKLKEELPEHLSYHSVGHIKDVYSACERLAQNEGVTGNELTLLLTAALFHDSGFLRDQKNHEKVSCDIACEYLPGYGYNPDDINKICGMIMATKVPQEPHTHLEEILCDADLDYLGRDDFFIIGNKLFSELSLYGIIHNQQEWDQLQVRFLEAHHYYTSTAIETRKAKKDAHLAIIKSRLA